MGVWEFWWFAFINMLLLILILFVFIIVYLLINWIVWVVKRHFALWVLYWIRVEIIVAKNPTLLLIWRVFWTLPHWNIAKTNWTFILQEIFLNRWIVVDLINFALIQILDTILFLIRRCCSLRLFLLLWTLWLFLEWDYVQWFAFLIDLHREVSKFYLP